MELQSFTTYMSTELSYTIVSLTYKGGLAYAACAIKVLLGVCQVSLVYFTFSKS